MLSRPPSDWHGMKGGRRANPFKFENIDREAQRHKHSKQHHYAAKSLRKRKSK